MNIKLLHFAVLRDIVGRAETDLSLPDGTRASDVWSKMRAEYTQLAGYETPPLIAINQSYAKPDAVLRDGDELAFIPPVAGG